MRCFMSSKNGVARLCINETPFQSVRQPTVDVAITFPLVSPVTKQCFKDEADINTIMSRYQSTGEMPVINEVAPQYLDATGFDFQVMQDKVVEARNLFSTLPSSLRNRFSNDPAEFLSYVADEANYPEMRKLGLLKEVALPQAMTPPTSDSASGKVD
ncbi:MAG: internal scaffolding protein [Microviridae sp.]|nr:MAG: internal scaffolding protein [Microviridae sp.]